MRRVFTLGLGYGGVGKVVGLNGWGFQRPVAHSAREGEKGGSRFLASRRLAGFIFARL